MKKLFEKSSLKARKQPQYQDEGLKGSEGFSRTLASKFKSDEKLDVDIQESFFHNNKIVTTLRRGRSTNKDVLTKTCSK